MTNNNISVSMHNPDFATATTSKSFIDDFDGWDDNPFEKADPDNIFDDKCEWFKVMQKLEEKEDEYFEEVLLFKDYLCELSDVGLINIKSSTNWDSLVEQIRKAEKTSRHNDVINRIGDKYTTFFRLLLVEFRKYNRVFINQQEEMKRVIWDIYKENYKLLHISHWKFEEIIAELLLAKKFKVELTSKTWDNGYDILAIQNVFGFPIKFLVECKRYTRKPIGIDIIRRFSDVLAREQANKGIIVTTSYFTEVAWLRQRERCYLLDFREKNDVLNWIKEYCERMLI